MPTYPFPRIKLAESEQDEGNLNFFERHPKKLLAAGGVLGGLAVHRLLKGKGMAGSYKSNSGPKGGASAGGGRPPATGGGGPGPRPSAPAGGPKPPSSPTAPQPSAKEAPKIVATPPKDAPKAVATHSDPPRSFGPRREFDPKAPKAPKAPAEKHRSEPSPEMLKRVAPELRKKAPATAPESVSISPEAEKELGRRQVEKFKARAAKAGDAPKITKTPSDSVPAKTSPPERAPRKNTVVLPPTIKNVPKTVKRDVRQLKKTAPAQAEPKATPAPEPKPEAPKIRGVKKGTRVERLAARAAEDAKKALEGTVPEAVARNVNVPMRKREGGMKLASVRDFALWAALIG